MRSNSVWDDFKAYVWDSDNTLNKLIALNVAVFLLFGIFWLVLKLFTLDETLYIRVTGILSLPSSPKLFLYKPWTIITYQFMHSGIGHIFFNMLIFNFAGKIMREYLGDKKLLATYILGGIAGGVLYILSYSIFPMFNGQQADMVGASACIMAVLAAIGTLLPRYTVFIIIIGPVQLVYIVIFLLAIDLLSITASNSGGHIAHIGGMAWGFIYIKSLQNGRDLGAWLTGLIDRAKVAFKPKSKLKMSYVNDGYPRRDSSKKSSSHVSQAEIDAVLDKIAKSGYSSLSSREKEVLKRASKEED
ncbi:MAG: rhomboid family intramembrane serine protease [Bacteroidetes bacterium]|nr:rhomboid family intramembrane serine protease [Bacteroidota bacterium]